MDILHGDYQTASRNFLTFLKKSFKGEIINFDGLQVNLNQLQQTLDSRSLFNQPRLTVIENLFKRPKSQDKETILDYLAKLKPKNLIIWEAKIITPTSLKKFSFAKIRVFKLPAIIWQFLDTLTPNNPKRLIFLFHLLQKQIADELIFYWLSQRISQLIIARDLGQSGLAKMAPWQQSKLINQANKFKLKQLIDLYHQLFVVDYQIKSGQTNLPLSFHLDLLLSSI